MHYPVIFLLLLTSSALPLFAYRFECVNGCVCDTDDEVIHCHDRQLHQIPLPASGRLRGFMILGLSSNHIVDIGNEQVIINNYPDLKAIDIENNPAFDCQTLGKYKTIKILSDCDKKKVNNSSRSQIGRQYRPDSSESVPTLTDDECSIGCQLQRHYISAHEYVQKIWLQLKNLYYANMDKDKIAKDVQDFLVKLFKSR